MKKIRKKKFSDGKNTQELGCSRNTKANVIRTVFSKYFGLQSRDQETIFQL